MRSPETHATVPFWRCQQCCPYGTEGVGVLMPLGVCSCQELCRLITGCCLPSWAGALKEEIPSCPPGALSAELHIYLGRICRGKNIQWVQTGRRMFSKNKNLRVFVTSLSQKARGPASRTQSGPRSFGDDWSLYQEFLN